MLRPPLLLSGAAGVLLLPGWKPAPFPLGIFQLRVDEALGRPESTEDKQTDKSSRKSLPNRQRFVYIPLIAGAFDGKASIVGDVGDVANGSSVLLSNVSPIDSSLHISLIVSALSIATDSGMGATKQTSMLIIEEECDTI